MTSVLRVLHVSSGNLYGGIETVLVALARFRSSCPAMDPQFALSFAGRLSGELSQTGVTVHQLGEVRTRKPWTVWAARRRLRSLLAQQRFDFVVCHTFWPMAIFGKAAHSCGARLAFWAHDAAQGRHWLERWAGLVTPDVVIGNSLYTQASVPAVFPGVPSFVIHCPVALQQPKDTVERRAALRKELGVSDETVAIIQVSRMEAWKGHRLHLQALSRLKKDPKWVCFIVGGAQRPMEHEYQRSLEREAAELGIGEQVRFLGQRSDVQELLNAANIFCQPNQGPEPFGIVFVEALFAGLPVVTTAMGGPKEIVNEDCGIVVPPENPDQLASALQNLVDSPDLRKRLGANGPSRARELSDPAQRIAELCSILSQTMGN